jgi:hypothetical protein
MDYEVLKKKLDAYRKPSGQFRQVKGDLLIELLRAWEGHTGPSSEFAKQLGMKRGQLGRLVQAARKIAATTAIADATFHELQHLELNGLVKTGTGIEMVWGSDKIIRFPTVDSLVDFLKRAS